MRPCSEEKYLILVQCAYGGWQSDYHVVDLKAKKLSTTPISTLLNDPGFGETVQLGSFIYSVGGYTTADPEVEHMQKESGHHIHLGASFFKFSRSHLLSWLNKKDDHDRFKFMSIMWKEAPPLLHDWEGLSCCSLGDKIYAFGGSSLEYGVGQEFSPQCGQWKPLPQPPDDLPLDKYCVSSPIIADEKNDRLLVHIFSAKALCAYYPGKRTWDCLDPHFPCWRGATALADGVLYAHVQGILDCLVAYDVSNKLWLEVVYSSPFPLKVCKYEFTDMLHLGNSILCLANDPPTFDDLKLKYSNLLFVKFSVKRTSPTQVLVTPGDLEYYPFDKHVRAIRFFAI